MPLALVRMTVCTLSSECILLLWNAAKPLLLLDMFDKGNACTFKSGLEAE